MTAQTGERKKRKEMVTSLPKLIVAYTQHLAHNCPHPLPFPGFGSHPCEVSGDIVDFEHNLLWCNK